MAVKTADLRHEGGFRFVARTGSGFEIAMDNEAGGTGARPTEVLAAAIGGCTAMDVDQHPREEAPARVAL